jgi:glycyl-tRNA synthetase beta chain
VHIRDVAERAADKAQSQKLMPVSVGLDGSGKATAALLKKLQALGSPNANVAELRRAMDGKAESLFLDSTSKGVDLADGVQEALRESIARLPIPKVMTYQLQSDCELPGWSSVSFVRPAHGLVALHGSAVVPVQALGLRSGRTTRGHRFESSVDVVEFRHADEYAERLVAVCKSCRTLPCWMKSLHWSSAPTFWSAVLTPSSWRFPKSA